MQIPYANSEPQLIDSALLRWPTTSGAGGEDSREHTVVSVSAEDYEQEGKDYTSVKVIRFGDSAFGK